MSFSFLRKEVTDMSIDLHVYGSEKLYQVRDCRDVGWLD